MNKESFAILYQIIQYLSQSEYALIPKERIEAIQKQMDKNYPKVININTDYSSLDLSDDIVMALFCLHYLYILDDAQKAEADTLLNLQEDVDKNVYFESVLNDIFNQKENQSIDYNKILSNINGPKPNQTEEKITTPDATENTQLIDTKTLSIFTRIKNFVLGLFKKQTTK